MDVVPLTTYGEIELFIILVMKNFVFKTTSIFIKKGLLKSLV
jgi:hypothetical protein